MAIFLAPSLSKRRGQTTLGGSNTQGLPQIQKKAHNKSGSEMQQARESAAEIMRRKQAAGTSLMWNSHWRDAATRTHRLLSKWLLPCGQVIGSTNNKPLNPTADAKKQAAKDAEVQAKKDSNSKKK